MRKKRDRGCLTGARAAECQTCPRPPRSLQGRRARLARRIVFLLGGLCPEEAVGHHLTHAGAVAEIEAMIEVFDGLMHRLIELGAIGEYRGEHRRQGIARAGEPGLEQLETLAQQHPPRAHQHVLHPALAGHDTGHQQILHAELLRLLHQRIERGRRFAVPLRQQQLGERALVAGEHAGLRQDEILHRLDVIVGLRLVEHVEIAGIGDQRHLTVVSQQFGHGIDHVDATEKADLPGRDLDVFEHGPRLFHHGVGLDLDGVENLCGIAYPERGRDRQGMAAHGRARRQIGREPRAAAGVSRVEEHHGGGGFCGFGHHAGMVVRLQVGASLGPHRSCHDLDQALLDPPQRCLPCRSKCNSAP